MLEVRSASLGAGHSCAGIVVAGHTAWVGYSTWGDCDGHWLRDKRGIGPEGAVCAPRD